MRLSTQAAGGPAGAGGSGPGDGAPGAGGGAGPALTGVRRVAHVVIGRQGDVRRPIAFLILGVIIATIITPDFIRPSNINSLLTDNSYLVVIAVGEAFVIMVGSIDLGVESLLVSAGMLIAWLTVFHAIPSGLAVVFTLVGALVLGLLVGLLVAKVHIPSFVVTLGIYWGFRGVALLINNQQGINPPGSQSFGFSGIAGSTGGVSNLLIIALAVVIVAQVLLSLTPFGLWLKSIGSNELATRRAGINADRAKISVFAISAVLAALAGIMYTAWAGTIVPGAAEGYSLEAIAAVILGGIPFTGGRGSAVGAALGALMVGIINDLIVLLGVPSLWEYVFVAAVLIVAGLQARSGRLVK
jgi:ribose/xylose/arabinose/galactoside ABC-type transport system permease subunit